MNPGLSVVESAAGDNFGDSRLKRACTRRSLKLVSAFRAVYLKTHGEVAERLKAAVC